MVQHSANLAVTGTQTERTSLHSDSPASFGVLTEEQPHRCHVAQTLTRTSRREVEAAQNGAAADRAARAAAEAALSEARESLRDTHEMLQESLNNGPKAALAALLAEKEGAEVEAATAVAMAEAAAEAAARAQEEERAEERLLSRKERDQVINSRMREFSATRGPYVASSSLPTTDSLRLSPPFTQRRVLSRAFAARIDPHYNTTC